MFRKEIVLTLISFNLLVADKPCMARKYNHSSIVCVCNNYYCDEISSVQKVPSDQYVAYSSSMDGLRFNKTINKQNERLPKTSFRGDIFETLIFFASRRSGDVKLKIYRNIQYQEIFGFGGSFTDAAGYNIIQLSEKTQLNFMKSYFGHEGIEYNMGRVPIGGTDFSTHPYAYNSEPMNDIHLSNFSLTLEDFMYKIPFIKEANKMVKDKLYLLTATWSPPVWMKSNKAYGGASKLLEEYYSTYADYHIKFLEEYYKNNITFWAISTGNEPSNGRHNFEKFNTLGWDENDQVKWIADFFGPKIKSSKFSDILILAIDDQRFCLPTCVENIAKNREAYQYIDGIATHWYWDGLFSVNLVDRTHAQFPEKFFIASEACLGTQPWVSEKVQLGSWLRAELYAQNIIEDLNHWYTGWLDWNLALDINGGPNWYKNYAEAAIIVIPSDDEFLKQPIYYIMGHFSKFIPRGSKRVMVETIQGDIENVAFLRPDGGIVVIFYNPTNDERVITIEEDGKGFLEFHVQRRSIHSILYW